MNRYKFLSGFLILASLVVVVGSIYLLVSYSTGMFKAIVDFITINDLNELSRCGATLPPQFSTVKDDLTTMLLPALYYGIPLLLLLVSVLVFFAGFYYHKGLVRDETKKREEIEKEVERKAAGRAAREAKDQVKGKGRKSEATQEDDEEDSESEMEEGEA